MTGTEQNAGRPKPTSFFRVFPFLPWTKSAFLVSGDRPHSFSVLSVPSVDKVAFSCCGSYLSPWSVAGCS